MSRMAKEYGNLDSAVPTPVAVWIAARPQVNGDVTFCNRLI
jgi:hypothetical protein